MSTLTADIVSGITVLEECPVVITVTYSGDDVHRVTETTDIVYSLPKNTSFDCNHGISRDTEKNTCVAKFVVTAHSGASDFTIMFSMDKATDPNAKLEIVFHPIDKNGFSYAAFEPIIIGDSWIKDLSPAEDDEQPSKFFNGSLFVNIYAQSKTNDPLPYFQIPLVTDKPVRIFEDDREQLTTEILPFISENGNYQYYINTSSRGSVALRIFPKKFKGNYSVRMFTKLPYLLRNASSNILFITEDIVPNLPAPNIEELIGDKLTPQIGNSNTGFHVIIPSYAGANLQDQIFLVIREDSEETQSQSAVISNMNQFDMPFILVPYSNIPNIGDNELYYYVVDAIGNVSMSTALYFYLTKSVPNQPPEIRRTLAAPRIFTHKDQTELKQRGKINLVKILGGGLDARIAVGKKNGIDVDSIIKVCIYVSGVVNHSPSSKIYSLEPHTVTADEVTAGEAIILLGQAPFTGVDSYDDGPGLVYVTYSVNIKNSKIWFGRIDTVPPGQ
ncbi:hypothetical protein [Photorhabdus bodei]|uniref:Uncharacterized protein n=1 Tax=Photorhabdus bodei TaxID=2029681 RepID=A0A329X3T3_9GAMM|nr:hypothetical protein [Photorhabdus bodei]NDL01302.1 hypothetical protein [Photorhabdus bodei]NDL05591.1 hypothetical protein [Photorhabdus bodei]NDL09784.1 hypothetical protein [Photorhabdus bodei]RAX11554.1 hypothetical protein CKY02_13275 [Photorhabdus bodei]